MRSIELFAGAGGLALGVSLAGFQTDVVAEWNRWACDTIFENQRAGFPLVQGWSILQGDVRRFNWTEFEGSIDLIAGGPPCQPFSMGGKHRASGDDRDMFPATASIIRAVRPKAFIIENVKGLTRAAFANYYQYILLQLEFPEIVPLAGEAWQDHHARLQLEKASGAEHLRGLTYNVIPALVNAADYGVPQKRERVFIVGFRADLGIEWSFPSPTHSLDALLLDQWVEGDYWERNAVPIGARPEAPLIPKRLLQGDLEAPLRPWTTIREALAGMPEPAELEDPVFRNHRLQSGARVYPGHTGSPIDLPAKTLKAGVHGVPGGENMLVRVDGTVRYFSVRESARLQTFPDGYELHGSWTEAMRQLGNAVPVRLGQVVAGSVASSLINASAATIGRRLSVRSSA